MLIRIPKPLTDNALAEHAPDPEVTVADPLSGIVIIIDPASAEEGGSRKTPTLFSTLAFVAVALAGCGAGGSRFGDLIKSMKLIPGSGPNEGCRLVLARGQDPTDSLKEVHRR